MTMRKIIRADGTEEQLERAVSVSAIREIIKADALDSFGLRDRLHVCFVDDAGYEKDLPSNAAATKLYHAVCRPGTTHQILGDVVIAPDMDYA
jgi:hypothetical protein